MIKVVCRCSHRWEVSDDQASSSLQCPNCGLLVDVPNLGDIHTIATDGTYLMDEHPQVLIAPHAPPRALEYYGGSDGEVANVDLRGPVNPDLLGMPTEDASVATKPRYDPETGELIQPLPVKPDENLDATALVSGPLPVAQQVFEYNRSSEGLLAAPHGFGVLVSLFAGVNLIVMGGIFIAHLLMAVILALALYIPFFIVLPVAILVGIISHYPLVLDEMGPNERDELPRPLGNVDPFDDIFFPFIRMCGSLVLCYWPILLILLLNFRAAIYGLPLPVPHAREPLLLCLLLGGIFFPAVFLTLCTSGSLVNLNPIRVLRLIPSIGWSYLPLLLLWCVASATYLCAMGATIYQAANVIGGRPRGLLGQPYIAYPLMMLGIYLMHAFCWYLGLAYRTGHENFPWAWQIHRRKTTPPLRRPRPPLAGKTPPATQERRKRLGVR